VDRLRSVFHPKAALFGEIKGEPYQKSLDEYLAIVANRQSPRQLGETLRMKAVSVEVAGHIAFVRCHSPMLGFNYTDHLSLVETDGEWLIVSKTFTHIDA
jgi:hypothetical protein